METEPKISQAFAEKLRSKIEQEVNEHGQKSFYLVATVRDLEFDKTHLLEATVRHVVAEFTRVGWFVSVEPFSDAYGTEAFGIRFS